jgi:hypothetical protein
LRRLPAYADLDMHLASALREQIISLVHEARLEVQETRNFFLEIGAVAAGVRVVSLGTVVPQSLKPFVSVAIELFCRRPSERLFFGCGQRRSDSAARVR